MIHKTRTLFPAALIIVAALTVPSNPGALAQVPNDGSELSATLNKAIRLTDAGNPQEAATMLRVTVKKYPNAPAAHFYFGNALCDSKQYQEAINEYEIALNSQQSYPDAELNIAYCYCNLGRQAESLPWFQRYLTDNPAAANHDKVEGQMLVAQASLLTDQKSLVEARQLLNRAVELAPTNTSARFRLARVCDELGNTDEAITQYAEVIKLEPKNSAAVFNIAGCYQSLGQPTQAIEWFKKYLNTNPSAADRKTVANMIDKLKAANQQVQTDPQGTDYFQALKSTGALYRWAPGMSPLKVFIAGGAGVGGYQNSYAQCVIDSFNSWAQASQNKIGFVLQSSPSGANITCQWTDNPFNVMTGGTDVEQGACLIQRHTDLNGGYGIIDHVDMRLLTIDRETKKPISDDEMKKTALHEVGHTLGINGHSPNNHDIMFYSVSPTVWPVLSKRDKATLGLLYADYPMPEQQQTRNE